MQTEPQAAVEVWLWWCGGLDACYAAPGCSAIARSTRIDRPTTREHYAARMRRRSDDAARCAMLEAQRYMRPTNEKGEREGERRAGAKQNQRAVERTSSRRPKRDLNQGAACPGSFFAYFAYFLRAAHAHQHTHTQARAPRLWCARLFFCSPARRCHSTSPTRPRLSTHDLLPTSSRPPPFSPLVSIARPPTLAAACACLPAHSLFARVFLQRRHHPKRTAAALGF